MDSYLLTLLTFLPMLGGLVIMLAPQSLARMGAFFAVYFLLCLRNQIRCQIGHCVYKFGIGTGVRIVRIEPIYIG